MRVWPTPELRALAGVIAHQTLAAKLEPEEACVEAQSGLTAIGRDPGLSCVDQRDVVLAQLDAAIAEEVARHSGAIVRVERHP